MSVDNWSGPDAVSIYSLLQAGSAPGCRQWNMWSKRSPSGARLSFRAARPPPTASGLLSRQIISRFQGTVRSFSRTDRSPLRHIRPSTYPLPGATDVVYGETRQDGVYSTGNPQKRGCTTRRRPLEGKSPYGLDHSSMIAILDRLLGRPLATAEEEGQRIGGLPGVALLGLDGLSSAACGPEAAMTILLPPGAADNHMNLRSVPDGLFPASACARPTMTEGQGCPSRSTSPPDQRSKPILPGTSGFFGDRSGPRAFHEASKARDGDQALIERRADGSYAISLVRK